MKHVLVTNDFPPKVGGIQSYLWELWRRLPADDVTVLTTPYEGDRAWDAAQPYRVVRTREKVLLPDPRLARRIDGLADEVGAELVVLDPALPLGLLGPRLRHPYGLVLHGAEVTVPGRLPAATLALRRVLRRATIVIAAGSYPLAEAERAARRSLPATNIPPGVDIDRFQPIDDAERDAIRKELDLPRDAVVVSGISRLVPRKGFDVLLQAAGRLRDTHQDLVVAIGGTGRDRGRLERIARETGAPARFLGRISDALLPSAFACGDVYAMLCRNRWGGLEQEGFGIVFLEAAAAGVPQVAGRSGGSHEAVLDDVTGFVVDDPRDPAAAAAAIGWLLDDPPRRATMGAAARDRAVASFSYDHLAARLRAALGALQH